MSQFAFYRKVVALNSDMHRNLKFAANEVNFSFARDTTAVLLAGVELPRPHGNILSCSYAARTSRCDRLHYWESVTAKIFLWTKKAIGMRDTFLHSFVDIRS